MDIVALRKWLREPRSNLVSAIAEGAREHVAKLRSRGVEFYGYALLPGEPYDIRGIVAVTNTEVDIKVPRSDTQYRYYRYCVDEWKHWDHDGFAAANALIVDANAQFQAMHTKADDDYTMDEFEIAHADALLAAVVSGLQAAKDGGTFGDAEPFLVVWISNADADFMVESVRQLNSQEVAQSFAAEFGEAG